MHTKLDKMLRNNVQIVTKLAAKHKKGKCHSNFESATRNKNLQAILIRALCGRP